MASAFEQVATAIIAAFNTEFAPEGLTMIPDRLHESLGRYRMAAGISPDEERPRSADRNTSEFYFTVQFFGLWDDTVDPGTQINPFQVTGYAERFKTALRDASFAASGDVWFFDIDRLQYPPDPTDNKSRFVATIRAYGNNTNLLETTA
jgi:hypothetical protein